jgi:hypothetical protein
MVCSNEMVVDITDFNSLSDIFHGTVKEFMNTVEEDYEIDHCIIQDNILIILVNV